MDEARGVWIHDSTCRAMGGREVAKQAHQHGINLLLPKVPWLTGPLSDRSYWQDVMEPMIKEAHKLDMEVHAWIFFLDDASVDGDRSLMQRLENGKIEYAACPANPETVKRNLEKIEPILSEYDLDGFSLEDCFVYHRWPKDPMTCYCEYCKKHAPADPQKRMAWNTGKLTSLLRRIVKESKKYSSNLKISAAARVPYSISARSMCADWKSWSELGLLDFIAPMIYEKDIYRFLGLANETIQILSSISIPVYIGLGAYVLDRELTGHDMPTGLLEQIRLTRKLGVDGHILYHMGGITQDQYIRMAQAYSEEG